MNNKTKKIIYWTPRILSIILILFLSLFSLDVFDSNADLWQTVLGLLIHNIPSIVLIILLIIAWKREIVGGIVFILAGLLYIGLLFTNPSFEWYMISWSFLISGPAFLIGGLFLINWYNNKKIKNPTKNFIQSQQNSWKSLM